MCIDTGRLAKGDHRIPAQTIYNIHRMLKDFREKLRKAVLTKGQACGEGGGHTALFFGLLLQGLQRPLVGVLQN